MEIRTFQLKMLSNHALPEIVMKSANSKKKSDIKSNIDEQLREKREFSNDFHAIQKLDLNNMPKLDLNIYYIVDLFLVLFCIIFIRKFRLFYRLFNKFVINSLRYSFLIG